MASIKTAGDLRGFLADVLVGIRNGSVDTDEANAIAKVAAQINQSLAVEVNTTLQLQRMGKDQPVAGSMMLTNGNPAALETFADDAGKWCEQCDKRVSPQQIAACKSQFCKARGN